MRTAIVADTNSGITPEEAAERGITLIPMPFLIDGAEYREGEDCTQPFFFARLAAGAEVATSQPSPGGITERWDHLLEDHDAILHFPMSASLSGSCQTAKALALDYPGKVFVVDNRRISVTLLQSLRQAQRLLSEGKSAEEVHRILEERAGESSIYIAVNTLEYLKKGGRVTAATADSAREYGKTETYFRTDCKLFKGLPAESVTWMSHGDYMEKVPEGFSLVAHSDACPNVAICDEARGFYGVQYHPEFKSRPNNAHPLFKGFIQAALEH